MKNIKSFFKKISESHMDTPNRVIEMPYVKVEEFIINGGRWVYVNDKLVNETFDSAIKNLSII